MYAVKENKTYKCTEADKRSYLARGFDIFDDKGKLIEKSPSATVPYTEHKVALDRIAALEKQLAKKEKSDA